MGEKRKENKGSDTHHMTRCLRLLLSLLVDGLLAGGANDCPPTPHPPPTQRASQASPASQEWTVNTSEDLGSQHILKIMSRHMVTGTHSLTDLS